MQPILFSGKLCHRPGREQLNAARGVHVPVDLSRAGSLTNHLGRDAARGWFLLSRSQLDDLDLNALHHATFRDGTWGEVTAYNLVVTREPVKTHYTARTLREEAIYLVEAADRRWLACNPLYQGTLNAQYNVRAPGYQGLYYADSTNAGTAWTWTGMAGQIWAALTTQLGSYPGLPFTPDGTPEGWIFPGVSAWEALCAVLARIGCAVKCDLTQETSQYTIVRVGADDSRAATLLVTAQKKNRLLHDAEFYAVTRGRLPRGVKVHFHRKEVDYGTENDTPQTSSQWQTGSVYTVQIEGPETTDSENIYHTIWDDLPALYNTAGSLTNSTALNTRAQERSDDYFRMLRAGGSRFYRCYDGVLGLSPGSTVKTVTWRVSSAGAFVTDVIRHPFLTMQEEECCDGGSTKVRPPDFAPTQPVWPRTDQVVEIVTAAPSSGVYDSYVRRNTTAPNTWGGTESVWCVDLAGSTSLEVGRRYLGRLVGHYSSRPLYAIDSGCCELSTATDTIEGQEDDYDNPPADTVYLTVTGDQSITGITAPDPEYPQTVTYVVTSGGTLTFTHEDTDSTAANRIDSPTDTAAVLVEGQQITLTYNTTADRWDIVSTTGTYQPAVINLTTTDTDDSAADVGSADKITLVPDGTPRNLLGLTSSQTVAGTTLSIYNGSPTYSVTLLDEDAGADAGNQFDSPNGLDFVLPPGATGTLERTSGGKLQPIGPGWEYSYQTTSSTGDVDDLAVHHNTPGLVVTGSGGTRITGLDVTGVYPGWEYQIVNTSSGTVYLIDEDSQNDESEDGNKFSLTATVALGPGATATVVYVSGDAPYYLVTTTGTQDLVVPSMASIEGATLEYEIGDGAVAITSTLTLSDSDSGDLTKATIAITSGFDASHDELAFSDTGDITGSWNGTTGVLTLTGTDSLADWQTALRSVTFESPSGADEGTRTITFRVFDGIDWSTAVTRDIEVEEGCVIAPGPTCSDCDGGDAPSSFTVVLAGLNEGALNDTHQLDPVTDCSWAVSGGVSGYAVALGYNSGAGEWELWLDDSGGNQALFVSSDSDCMAPRSFTLFGVAGTLTSDGTPAQVDPLCA